MQTIVNTWHPILSGAMTTVCILQPLHHHIHISCLLNCGARKIKRKREGELQRHKWSSVLESRLTDYFSASDGYRAANWAWRFVSSCVSASSGSCKWHSHFGFTLWSPPPAFNSLQEVETLIKIDSTAYMCASWCGNSQRWEWREVVRGNYYRQQQREEEEKQVRPRQK